jgi:hypothetical protein
MDIVSWKVNSVRSYLRLLENSRRYWL